MVCSERLIDPTIFPRILNFSLFGDDVQILNCKNIQK